MPVNKKRKVSNSDDDDDERRRIDYPLSQILSDEFDLEISLRERLVETVQSRITWALLLQETLANDVRGAGTSDVNLFEDAALEALAAIESPSALLFSKESNHVLASLPDVIRSKPPVPVAAQPIRPRQPTARSRPNPRLIRSTVTKLLFIRNTTVIPPTVAKMACTDCSRSDFTNLQGLLNHCRLSHKRDYGSHDECMQQCAVIVPEEESDWVIAHGTELSGVSLPSLRRLFEIAVGEKENAGILDKHEENVEEEREVPSVTHLSRTLGHHKDTPALAPFLGRAPKRRCINVFEEDEPVDITEEGTTRSVTSRPAWRMPYTHRSVARPQLDIIADSSTVCDPTRLPTTTIASGHQQGNVRSDTIGTRFHIIARVNISDRSVWIPPERRPRSQEDHTHRWILSVDSPSYSLHITAFLAKVTVTCITDPPPSSFTAPMVVAQPPFSVSGLTKKPFLARLSLTWAGGDHVNPQMEVEHWVELDPFKAANPVLGDEQVLDVELDRNTELLPIRKDSDYRSLDMTRSQEGTGVSPSALSPTRSSEERNVPSYVTTLKSLLPLVPLTMKDVKGGPPSKVPYKLATTPAQFRGFVAGRRKAIEWGRARALREEYENVMKIPPSGTEPLPLTTADVYHWLVDEDPLRPTLGQKHDVSSSSTSIRRSKYRLFLEGFCPACGLDYTHHNFTVKAEETIMWPTCNMVPRHLTRIPCVDVNRLLSLPSQLPQPSPWRSPQALRYTARDLVSAADPNLTLAIRDLLEALKLPSFASCSDPSSFKGNPNCFPLTVLGGSMDKIADNLAVHALLSLLTQTLVKFLVQSGLDAAKRDASKTHDRRRKPRSCLLTPSQVIEGLRGVLHDPSGKAAFLCFARLGISSDSGHVSMETRRGMTPGVEERSIKVEDA